MQWRKMSLGISYILLLASALALAALVDNAEIEGNPTAAAIDQDISESSHRTCVSGQFLLKGDVQGMFSKLWQKEERLPDLCTCSINAGGRVQESRKFKNASFLCDYSWVNLDFSNVKYILGKLDRTRTENYGKGCWWHMLEHRQKHLLKKRMSWPQF